MKISLKTIDGDGRISDFPDPSVKQDNQNITELQGWKKCQEVIQSKVPLFRMGLCKYHILCIILCNAHGHAATLSQMSGTERITFSHITPNEIDIYFFQ